MPGATNAIPGFQISLQNVELRHVAIETKVPRHEIAGQMRAGAGKGTEQGGHFSF